jgi:hypothetical protein
MAFGMLCAGSGDQGDDDSPVTISADLSDEPLFAATRHVLLNALAALGTHRGAVVLVGAQAVFLRTQTVRMPGSFFTRDADLSVDPDKLLNEPELLALMNGAGFRLLGTNPGAFAQAAKLSDGREQDIELDLMVAADVAPGSVNRRSVTLPDHDKMALRRTPGLEATLVDNEPMVIRGLGDDTRSYSVPVAGIPSLLIAKAVKLGERIDDARAGHSDRVKAKDAGDVYRLVLAVDNPGEIRNALRDLAQHPMAGPSTIAGITYLRTLFARPRSTGIELAQSAVATEPPDRIAAILNNFIETALPMIQE